MAPLSSSPVATKTRGSRSRAVSFSDESDDDWMVPPTTKPVTETGSSTPTNSGQTVVPSSGNKLSELLAAKSKTAKRREAYTALSESLASESGEGATGAAIQMPEELAEQMEAPSWLTAVCLYILLTMTVLRW